MIINIERSITIHMARYVASGRNVRFRGVLGRALHRRQRNARIKGISIRTQRHAYDQMVHSGGGGGCGSQITLASGKALLHYVK